VTSINNHSAFTVKQRKRNCSWVQFLTGRRPMRSFSPRAVATIALSKSAPMSSVYKQLNTNANMYAQTDKPRITKCIFDTELLNTCWRRGVAGPVSTWMGDSLRAGIPSRYVTSQLGQLSLASLRGRLIEYQLRLG